MLRSMVLKRGVVLFALLFAAALVLPIAVSAQDQDREGGQPAEVATRIAERRQAAKERISEQRENAETKSQEARQAACERRTEKLESAMDRLVAQATRLLGVMDSFHERVEGFYESGQLTVANYDELIGNVDVAQEAAYVEVAALLELNVDINCEEADVAAVVSAFRGSTQTAKDSLREYRRTLVELISAMRSEAADSASADEGTGQPENESESESEVEEESEDEVENEEEQ